MDRTSTPVSVYYPSFEQGVESGHMSSRSVQSADSRSTSASTEIGLLSEALTARSFSDGSSSDSFITDESSTVPSRLTSSLCGDRSAGRSLVSDDDDFSELTDANGYEEEIAVSDFPSKQVLTSFDSGSLNTQKLVRTASDIAPDAFRSALAEFRGILSDSSCSSSPWVDSSGSSSFDNSSEASLSRQLAGSRKWAHRIVAVATEGTNQSSPIDVRDIETGHIIKKKK